MMTQDQLELVVSRTGHGRLRALTSDGNSDVAERDGYRAVVEAMFVQFNSPQKIPPAESEYPSLLEQVGNAAKAAIDFVASGCDTVDQAEFDRRRAICLGCVEFYDAKQDRCRACGCNMQVKTWGKVFDCKQGKW